MHCRRRRELRRPELEDGDGRADEDGDGRGVAGAVRAAARPAGSMASAGGEATASLAATKIRRGGARGRRQRIPRDRAAGGSGLGGPLRAAADRRRGTAKWACTRHYRLPSLSSRPRRSCFAGAAAAPETPEGRAAILLAGFGLPRAGVAPLPRRSRRPSPVNFGSAAAATVFFRQIQIQLQ